MSTGSVRIFLKAHGLSEEMSKSRTTNKRKDDPEDIVARLPKWCRVVLAVKKKVQKGSEGETDGVEH